ncbi:hypothetical protein WJX73_005847 [Symbiochloris irregularis]|uniref:Uncharacterized protein n=1 Tax=Symbiochloris irregularis TaxID=706552 RepID=A0AAW1PNJ4_9CHLO
MAAPLPDKNYDYLLRLVLTGDSGAGKTALLQRYVTGSYREIPFVNCGVFDFEVKRTFQLDGKRVKLQIWDLSGWKCIRTLTSVKHLSKLLQNFQISTAVQGAS